MPLLMKRPNTNSYRHALSSLVASFTLAAPLVAQSNASNEVMMAGELAPTVVVVTRTPVAIDEVSPSVAYISSDEMEVHQDRRLVDVLKRQPGVVLNTSGASGSLTSLFLRGTNSDHTGFFLDGRRLNSGFGNQYNLEFLALDNLASAQVLRGASSVNYGSSGIGGVVNLETRSDLGASVSDAFIEAEIGSNESRRGAFSASFAEDSWAFSIGASAFSTDNERPNDEFEGLSLNTRFDYQLTDTLTFELLGTVTDAEKELPDERARQNFTDVGDTESWLISPGLRYENGDWSGQFFYSRSQLTTKTKTFEYGFSAPFPSGFAQVKNDVKSDELYLQINYAGIEDVLFSTGVVYRKDEAYNSNLDSYDLSLPARSFNGSFEQLGAWSQVQWQLTEAFGLRLGGRYDAYSDFDESWNGSAEVIYELADQGLTLFAKLASSYAAPSAGDVAFDGDPSGTPLGPEESVSYEFGLKQVLLDDSLQIAVVAFRNEIEDLIGYAGLDAFNVNEATTEGIELSIDYAATDKIDLGLAYTYLTATDDENGVHLLRRPRHMLQASAFYRPTESLRFGITGTGYAGREDASFGPPPDFDRIRADQEDYFVVELLIDWQATEQLSFFARAENLFDEKYESVLGYPALGRTGSIGARWTF